MRQRYTIELVFLAVVIAVSVTGFSSLFRSTPVALTGYQILHIVVSLAWLLLLTAQLALLRQRRFALHRAIGKWILVAGPVLVASVSLLTAHSAAREAAAGTVDDLVVQNVTFTLELALLLVLAVRLRHDRNVHGALMLSTALMFLVIASFFTLTSYVPGFRIEGPETFDRFAKAGQLSALAGSVIGVVFFLRNVRSGWPWLLTSAFFILNGLLQAVVDQAGRTRSLTNLVGAIGEWPALGLAIGGSAALFWVAWRTLAPGR